MGTTATEVKETEVTVKWYSVGILKSETWYSKCGNSLVRKVIRYHNTPKNNKSSEQWWKDGKQHREDGPAEVQWDENGNKEIEAWYKNGAWYKENGPAITAWYKNGVKSYEYWFNHEGNEMTYLAWNEDGSKYEF